MKFTNIPAEELKSRIDSEGAVFIVEKMKHYLDRTQFLSAGLLHKMITSTPKQFLYEWELEAIARDTKEIIEDSPAQREGSAFHSILLEPDRFAYEFAVLDESQKPVPDKDYRTKANAEWKAAFEAKCQITEKIMLTWEQFRVVKDIQSVAMADPDISNILSQEGLTEISIYTKLVWNGFTFYIKIRPDRISTRMPFFLDVKTTKSASPEINRFPSDAASYGYDIKMALYYDLISDHIRKMFKEFTVENPNPELKRCLILAFEKTPPYDSMIYNITSDTIEIGRYRYRAALDRIAKCITDNKWPGYSFLAEEGHRGIVDLILPAWVGKEIIR